MSSRTEKARPAEPTFTKEQLLSSKHFEGQDRDVLAVLMKGEVLLPIDEAKRMIETFKLKEVL